MKRPNKYGNVRTRIDGRTFDSQKEARRYMELKLRQRAGEIGPIKCQPKYPLLGKSGFKVCEYWADFEYVENGTTVTEDVKSAITKKNPVYRLKKKFFEMEYGRPIREV